MKNKVLTLLAPLSGPVLNLTAVPDPVFAQKMVGDGIAIDPTSEILLSPCDGEIIQMHPAGHALTVRNDTGIEVLMHIGIDTVKLKGEGFTAKVKVGDQVKAGTPLIEFSADVLARNATSLVTVMLITDSTAQLTVVNKGLVTAGRDKVLEVIASAAATVQTDGTVGVISDPVTIQLANGLHARPAAQFVNIAKKYMSNIELRKASQKVNAKSVVSLLSLQVLHGDQVTIEASGVDADIAVKKLSQFLAGLTEHETVKATDSVIRKSSDKNIIFGVVASPGQVIGQVKQLRNETFVIPEQGLDKNSEKQLLTQALGKAVKELAEVRQQVEKQGSAAQSAIFSAHQELLEDPALLELTYQWLEKGKTAAYAWNQATSEHASRLASLNNELMANRANDLRDVGHRVLSILLNKPHNSVSQLTQPAILIAENLTPSETVGLDRDKVLGFCTTSGGSTSHVAILARSLGLPALAAIEPRALQIKDGTEIILDADLGLINLNPDDEDKKRIQILQEESQKKRKAALLKAHEAAITSDGHKIEVAANIGGVADAKAAVEMGCDGVGLLRSEFLFLDRMEAPSEDEQLQVYQQIADVLGKRPLIIRTLDVGGDKPLQYLPLDAEENPFLGLRGLRVGFKHQNIFRTQLRAILRVRSDADLHIMFPMVAQLEELLEAKNILEEERQRLGAKPIKIGIMIEVPSAALIADCLASEVDFFSIGTNDLTQYTLAMDRGHKELAKQVDALHPSILKLIEMTVQAAHKQGKWVGVCGGLASDPQAVQVLIGLGVDELSVSVQSIPTIKAQVRSVSLRQSQQIALAALMAQTAKQVRKVKTERATEVRA